MELLTVSIENPEGLNFILGQAHFIKTADDLHETLAASSPSLKFGLAFCEASGPALIRSSGNDAELTALAEKNAAAVGAGHSFIVFLKDGFPVNVLNAIKGIGEVCGIYCATANPAEVVLAKTDQGRAILGVVDGVGPKGVETEADRSVRREFLRKIGYKP